MGCSSKGRGCFKAYKAAARIDSSHSSRAGASADVCHQLPWPGIGSDEILAQLHGFLRWVDGALYGRKGQQVPGETKAIL